MSSLKAVSQVHGSSVQIQKGTLVEQLKALVSLQEVDLKIDQLKQQKSAVPATLKALEEAYLKAKAACDQKVQSLVESDKNKKQAQAAVELNNDRVSRANLKLEAVSNGQEFQAANKEIEQLKKLNAQLEEQMKKIDEDVVQIQKLSSQAQELLDKAQKALEDKKGESLQVVKKFEQELNELEGVRSPFVDQIEKRILAQYDRVRGVKAGVGVAPAVSGRCGVCNMMLPPQLFNELHRGHAMHQCPSCHRVLYLPASKSE